MIARGLELSLCIKIVQRKLQVCASCPLVFVEEEHHVARQHQDEPWTTFLGHQEDLRNSLVDDGRREMIFFLVQVLGRYHICPLSCIIALLACILIRLALILLLKEAGRRLLVHGNQVLHLHDEHADFVSASQDMTHGDHLNEFSLVADHERLLVGMAGVISQYFQQGGMPLMGTANGILYARMGIDDEVLVFFILRTQDYERLVQFLHFVGSTAGTFLHFVCKVLGEITRWEIITYVLYESVCYVVCHGNHILWNTDKSRI